MSDLQSVHKQALKLILSLRSGFERLESVEGSVAGVPPGLVDGLQGQVQQLQRLSASLESMHRMQLLRDPGTKPDVWHQRVTAVGEESTALQSALNRFMQRHQRRHAEVAERQQLLERRGALGEPARAYDDGAVRQSAESSKRMLEEAYQTGAAILGGMATQRDTLKSAHRKALDVLNSTGLSASLLRVIERRQSMDKILAYGGMALTLVLVILLYWWFKA